MIELLPAPDHVIAYRLAGHLTADDYDGLIAGVEAKLATHATVGVYADASGFIDIAPEALAKDFAYSFGKIGDWDRFRRVALVTDTGWLRALVRFAAPLAPGVQARVFAAGEQAQAMAWAGERPPAL
ncbi:MAG: STAS/SEC14 domain-containing protein [Pseudomonadota bacterium]